MYFLVLTHLHFFSFDVFCTYFSFDAFARFLVLTHFALILVSTQHRCVASNVLHMQHTKMLHAPCNINYGQPHATIDYGQAMQHMQHVAYVARVAATLLHVADSCNKNIDTAEHLSL